MELFFLALLIFIMATALGSGYPVAFALPGAAILTIGIAALAGWAFADNPDAYFHSGGPRQWLSAGVTNLRGVYWEVERDTLIAIPLFIFMGIMLQRSKIAEDLLVTMAQLFGPVPGGLGISVVFVGALLAATTGIVGATVVAMGLISLPAMLRNNYSPSLATGTIAASGTLGQIIPPSIVLIILADQLASASDQASTARKALHKEATGELSMPSAFDVASTSAGEMFLGAFVPGIVLVLLYMLFILVIALIRPSLAPAVPYEGTRDGKFWVKVFLTLVPPLALIFLVLGSIIGGIATVNQAGAIGAAGALIMAGYRLCEDRSGTYVPALIAMAGLAVIAFALSTYEMNIKSVLATGGDATGLWLGGLGTAMIMLALIWSGIRVMFIENTLQGVMIETAKTTSLVFIILLGAAMLTAAFRAFGGEELVREFLNSLPGGFWTQFIIVMAVIFILGFFLDFIEIAVVVVPIVAPILLADPSANITAVWLGVMIGLNIQTSFLTPPFGFALFYLRGVAPSSVKTTAMYKGVIAFIFLQLSALAIVGYYPPLVNYLPNRVSFLSETSPPPRNPKLQDCVDEYVLAKLGTNGGEASGALDALASLNFGTLPEDLRDEAADAIDNGRKAIAALADIETAHAAVEAAKPDYVGVLRDVRRHEKDARRELEEAEELKTIIGRLHADEEDRKVRLEARVAELESMAAAELAEVPADWDATHDAFVDLLKAEESARNAHRRAADQSYEALAEIRSVLLANDAFFALEEQLNALQAAVDAGPSDASEDAVKAVGSAFGQVAGADDVRSALSGLARNLRDGRGDAEEARGDYQEALDAFAAHKGWRPAAAEALLPGLNDGLATLSDTLGIRAQDRLSREQALFMAKCTARHRDISINF